jgi:hypothetical protein
MVANSGHVPGSSGCLRSVLQLLVLLAVAEGLLGLRLAPVVALHALSVVWGAIRVRLATQDGEIGVAHELRSALGVAGLRVAPLLPTALIV